MVKYGAARQPEARGHYLVIILLLSICFPILITIGSLNFNPMRIILILVTPVLGIKLLKGDYGKLTVPDGAVLAFAIWLCVCIAVNNPPLLISFGGSNALELLGAYLVGRAAVTDVESFARFQKIMVGFVVCLVPLAIFEAFTGNMLMVNAIQSAGIPVLPFPPQGDRLGLTRAQVVFPTPIHFGFLCSLTFSMLLIGLKGEIAEWKRWLGLAISCIGVFFSLSSGAILPVMLQLMLVVWGVATRRISARWLILLGIATPVYVILELISSRPAYIAILSRIAFNTSNVYFRDLQLEWGLKNVWANPIFGLGQRDWVRPGWMWFTASLDNFWLLNAMRYGIPGFLMFLVMVFYTMVKAARRKFPEGSQLSRLRLAFVLTHLSAAFTLATVHIWAQVYIVYVMFLSSGVWMLTYQPQLAEEKDAAETEAPRTMRYTRFSTGKLRERPAVRARYRRREPQV